MIPKPNRPLCICWDLHIARRMKAGRCKCLWFQSFFARHIPPVHPHGHQNGQRTSCIFFHHQLETKVVYMITILKLDYHFKQNQATAPLAAGWVSRVLDWAYLCNPWGANGSPWWVVGLPKRWYYSAWRQVQIRKVCEGAPYYYYNTSNPQERKFLYEQETC